MTDAELAELARSGELDALAAHAAIDPHAAYKWLLYADDLGREEAGDRLSDLDEHYDVFHYDEGYVVGTVHLALTGEYLRGTHVEPDFALACKHLDEFFFGTFCVQDDESVRRDAVDELARDVDEPTRAHLHAFVDRLPFRVIGYRVGRVQRLHELRAPKVIVDNELELLRQSVDSLAEHLAT